MSKCREGVSRIRSRKIHPHFASYLALNRAIVRSREITVAEICTFYNDFLRVVDADIKYPYLRLFSDRVCSEWLRSGQGHAEASLSSLSPVRFCMRGESAPYELASSHWQYAFDKLCNSQKIPIFSLAAALYRDYAFTSITPKPNDLVEYFCSEFGFVRGSEAFSLLFYEDSVFLGVGDLDVLDRVDDVAPVSTAIYPEQLVLRHSV